MGHFLQNPAILPERYARTGLGRGYIPRCLDAEVAHSTTSDDRIDNGNVPLSCARALVTSSEKEVLLKGNASRARAPLPCPMIEERYSSRTDGGTIKAILESPRMVTMRRAESNF